MLTRTSMTGRGPCRFCGLVISALLVVISGCQSKRDDSSADTNATNVKGASIDDVTDYEFHYDKSFVDVSKTLPDGSVDHLDLGVNGEHVVIAVVTIEMAKQDELKFFTTFFGPDELEITKEWAPAPGKGEGKVHRGVFLLPFEATRGRTETVVPTK